MTTESSTIDPGVAVNQNKIYCENKNTSFNCLLEKNDSIDHSSDIIIECQDFDPTNPNKPDGMMDLFKPYDGSNDRFPIVYFNNQIHFFCDTAFNNKKYADLYCKLKGFNEADPDNFAQADDQKKFIEKTKGRGYQFLSKVPDYDLKEKKLKKQMILVDKCAPVFINCKGTQSQVSLKASLLPQNRLNGPMIRNISCSTSYAELLPTIKGDPGSVYTFICPEGCASGGNLVGSGLYGFKSSICKAAVQQTILSNSSTGYVSIVIG